MVGMAQSFWSQLNKMKFASQSSLTHANLSQTLAQKRETDQQKNELHKLGREVVSWSRMTKERRQLVCVHN